jgi:hypothetical protein
MDPESIFSEALKKNTQEECARFLDHACGDNAELRIEVEALLSAHDDAGSFLNEPAEDLAATFGAGESLSDDDSGDAWRELLKPSESVGCIGTLGAYEVIAPVGRGGMGVVVQAHDPKLKRTVAIMATYLHDVRRGFRITQEIGDSATDVAIIGPVSTEELDQTVRRELLKKYSQPAVPPEVSSGVE